MDVRCERCKTEYEFDDARITEAGVTVKCTTCGHVFKVKKKALVVTVPVKAEDAPQQSDMQTSIAAPPAGAMPQPGEKGTAKEWKVRQSNGNVFNFRELTTLQKWIVERKVTREDEISLTGETWKRLGNIAELSSFFQVVEDAQKAQQFAALQSAGRLGYAPPTATPSGGYAVPSGDGAGAPLSYPHPSRAQTTPERPGVLHPSQQGSDTAVTQPAMAAVITSAAMPVVQAAPTPQVNVTVHAPAAPAPAAHHDDVASAQVHGTSGAGKAIIVVLLLTVIGGGGYFGYTEYWLPTQAAQKESQQREMQARLDAERKSSEARGEEAERARAKKAAEDAAKAAAAAAAAAAPAVADAGTVTASGSTPAEATPATAKKVVHDFDYWMAQGDRLRDRNKPEAALDAYGKASDLGPDRSEPQAGRGLALLDMGNKLQAESSFLQALKTNPRYGVALMGLAETYRAEGKKEEAVKAYEKYLDVLPNGPEAEVARQAVKRLQE